MNRKTGKRKGKRTERKGRQYPVWGKWFKLLKSAMKITNVLKCIPG